jgi:hypothetical protein
MKVTQSFQLARLHDAKLLAPAGVTGPGYNKGY